MAEPEHLSNHHRDTLEKVMGHPTSHNVEWRAVTSLLAEVADSEEDNGNTAKYTLNGLTLALHRPKGGTTLDEEQVVDVRNLLSQAGYR